MASTDPRRTDSLAHSSVFWLLGGIIFAACAEGVVTARGVFTGGGSGAAALVGFFAAALLITVPLLLASVALYFLISRPSVRTLGERLCQGLTGSKSNGASTAIVMSAIVLGGSVGVGTAVGSALSGSVTPLFVALAAASSAIAALALLTLCAVPLGQRIAYFIDQRGLGKSIAVNPVMAVVVVAIGAFAAFNSALPWHWSLLPTALLIGIACGLYPRFHRGFLEPLIKTRPRILGFIGTVALLAIAMTTMAKTLPRTVQHALTFHAPYAGSLIAIVGTLSDWDGDGYPSLLFGEDCNDHDPRIHPDARDVLGNGIDENCTGADARAYVPDPPPGFIRPPSLRSKPNIVLILLDALRPDHVGFAGYHRPTTPRLDAFKETAVWFGRAYTPTPRTRGAMASLFTGRDARNTPRRNEPGNRFTLKPQAVTVAETLAKVGYDTVGYTISYVAQHIRGLGQGFRIWQTPWPTEQWRKVFGRAATKTANAAIEYINDVPPDGSRPFFLFTHFRCNHDPYIKHPEWDFGDRDIDKYDSATAYCDREVGRLLDTLVARSDADQTALFVFSDHGELFGDHGYTNHGNSLYEPDVRIVLLVKIPGVDPQTVMSPVLLTDIVPTISALANVPPPKGGNGFNLLSYVTGEEKKLYQRPLFLFTDLKKGAIKRDASAVVQWPYKGIYDRKLGQKEVYHLESDPLESSNLSARNKQKSNQLFELLESYEVTLPHRRR
ncbi:MAG: sulfatase-like hydrolase/transferase [Myxococcota bacterium]|nr:sulfatase-like hydrolase/transferase [Myxococcota bacterium]